MRARNFKPGLFMNEILGAEDPMLTLVFLALMALADRNGILEDRPARIRAEAFPYRGSLDIHRYLTDLSRYGFIVRYEIGGQQLILVANFSKHQAPHHTEKRGTLPSPSSHRTYTSVLITEGALLTVNPPCPNGGNPPESGFIDSLNPYTPPTPPHAEGGTQPVPLIPEFPYAPSGAPRQRKRRIGALGVYRKDVAEVIARLLERWPRARNTQEGPQSFRNDGVAAQSRVEVILGEQPEVELHGLEESALAWIESMPDYPNAIEHFFGTGKPGKPAPWVREYRLWLTNREEHNAAS